MRVTVAGTSAGPGKFNATYRVFWKPAPPPGDCVVILARIAEIRKQVDELIRARTRLTPVDVHREEIAEINAEITSLTNEKNRLQQQADQLKCVP